jgi:hypothetical protein
LSALFHKVIPEPIGAIPEDALRVSDERAAWFNGMPQEIFRT